MKFEIVPVGEDNVVLEIEKIRVGEVFSGFYHPDNRVRNSYLRARRGILNLRSLEFFDLRTNAAEMQKISGYRQEGNLVEANE